MKVIHQLRSNLPKNSFMWDIRILSITEILPDNQELDLKILTLKTKTM